MLFTILIFLLPTTALYYLVFTLVSRVPRAQSGDCRLCLPAGSCGQTTHLCQPQQRVAVLDSVYWALEWIGVHPGGTTPYCPGIRRWMHGGQGSP